MARARVDHTLAWLRVMCDTARTGLHSALPLNPAVWEHGLTMVFDASPWGAGGFISRAGVPEAWFSTAWGPSDTERLGLRVGDHRDQALAEAYSILIGVKFWSDRWCRTPTVAIIKSDSKAALGAMERGGTTRSASINAVLKELSLVIAVAPSGLRLWFKHLAGAQNQWADSLSRIAQPGAGARVPAPLLSCTRTAVEERGAAFWRTAGRAEEVWPEGAVEDVEM